MLVMLNRALAVSILVLSLPPSAVLAQDDSTDPAPRREVPGWVEADPFSSGADDPLGLDTSDRLETVVPTQPGEEVGPNVQPRDSGILSAIAGVRETAHEVEVRLENGLARVDVRMTFTSSARHAAEVRYRLPVPAGASLAALEVCTASQCTDGRVDPSRGPLGPYDDAVRARTGGPGSPPAGHAAIVRELDGRELIWLRAAPVRPQPPRGRSAASGELRVRVRYVVAAPLRGGRARLSFPARGQDDRASAAQISVRSDELRGGSVDGIDAVERPVERAAWQPFEVSATLAADGPAVRAEAWTFPCASGRCVRLRARAAPRPVPVRDTILLLDASPSTRGATRGRMTPTLAAFLASLPSDTPIRIAVFAARARALSDEPTRATEVSIGEVVRALESELGSATRFEAAWELASRWARRGTRVVLIGDGGLTRSDEATRAAERLRAAGAELVILDVADRSATPQLAALADVAQARVAHAGAEADRAGAGHGMDALGERISALLAPRAVPGELVARVGRTRVSLGPLFAGEERVYEGPLSGPAAILDARAHDAPAEYGVALADRIATAGGAPSVRLAALATATPSEIAQCRTQGVFNSPSAVVGGREALVLADTRRCDSPAVPEPTERAPMAASPDTPTRFRRHDGPRQLPPRSLLTMIRQRIVPAARGCFRSDRRGRAAYQSRAVYTFRIADQEIVDSHVDGNLASELRTCLSDAIDELDIPPFDGVVNVTYPIYVAPQLPPPTLTLDADVADAVDALDDSDPPGGD